MREPVPIGRMPSPISLRRAPAQLDQLDEIERQTDRLADYPEIGRVGRKPGTRECVLNRTPFVLVYRVRPEAGRVEILRLLHGRQKYP